MAQTQTALLVTEIGKPIVRVTDWPIPEPGHNQIQLKVAVAGINPHDQKARDTGLIIAEHLPAVPANDVVGTVTKLGPGVTGIAIGDRVMTQSDITDYDWTQHGLQEYSLADFGSFAKIPNSITNDEAATLPCNIIAPIVAIFKGLQIPAPWAPEAEDFDYGAAALLVVGGGTSCGKFGVQLAKLAGIGKIVVVGGNKEELKGFGATHVLDRHGGYHVVLGQIRDIVGDDLIYAYDAINPPEGQLLALNALSSHKKGAMARLIPMRPVDETRVIGKKAGFEVKETFGSSQANSELTGPFWERLPEYLLSGKIKPLGYVVKHGLTADNVNEVLDAYRDGKPVTKTHIHI
ncbi:putative Enoyl reductase (ER) domain-containing protein [Seiridium cardinale]|uniref:Enoyl reductase (ER) domain-containing protein n=1 Tax=Seiridium cardinale TaxID=138064 RepID=A0ABR2X7L5_9PEZI